MISKTVARFFLVFLLAGLLSTVGACSVTTKPCGFDVKTLGDLDPAILQLALKAQNKSHAQGQVKNKDVLTIIDYSKPSHQKRLWVLDLKTKKVLHHTYVAHGQRSGVRTPEQFSNRAGSHQSSVGVFVTGEPYQGKHGLSLRLHGLERDFNDNAYHRAIVMHGAHYVTEQHARKGYLGRSHGCPAVPHGLVRPIVQNIKEGTLFFVYYPDKAWLKKSSFLV